MKRDGNGVSRERLIERKKKDREEKKWQIGKQGDRWVDRDTEWKRE